MRIDDIKRDDGWTVVSTMAGIFVGAIVIGALSLFWLNSNRAAERVNDVSQQETAALRVLNAAAKDIGDANPIVEATNQSIVVERRENNQTIRTRYWLDKSDPDDVKLIQSINPNASDAYGPTSTFSTEKVLADRAQYASDETLFDYFDSRGNQIGSPVSAGDLSSIARVDINFRADAGRGYVELSTKVSVGRSAGTAGGGPALCDIHDLTVEMDSGGVLVEFRGSNTFGVNRYEIFRNNVLAGTVTHAGGNNIHSYLDMGANVGAKNTYRVESIATGNARNTACAAVKVAVSALPSPEIGGNLVNDGLFARLYWGDVAGANRYTITYSRVDGTGDVQTITFNTPASGASVTSGAWQFSNTNGEISAVFLGSRAVLHQYSVSAVAPSGVESAPSNTIHLLTAPAPAQPSASVLDYSANRVVVPKLSNERIGRVTPEYQVNGTGLWTAYPGPRPVIPSETAQQGSSVTIPHIMVAGGATATNQSALGNTYRYAVTLTNVGPRVALPGESFADQTSTEQASMAIISPAILQYPKDPVFTARGTERAATGAVINGYRSNTGSADGSNLIRATGTIPTQVTRIQIRSYATAATTTVLETVATVNRTNAAQWNTLLNTGVSDSGELPGSRKFYSVVATNATGVSPAGATVKPREVAYQRPAAPQFSPDHVWGADMQTRDTITATGPNGEPDGNRLPRMRWANVIGGADQPWQVHQNDPAVSSPNYNSGFCASDNDSADCAYQILRRANDGPTWQHRVTVDPDSGYNWRHRQFDNEYASGWNVKDVYGIRACNAGGCSDIGTRDVITYPGPFTQRVPEEPRQMTARAWANTPIRTSADPHCMILNRNQANRCTWSEPYRFSTDASYPGMKTSWDAPEGGAGSYVVTRIRDGYTTGALSQTYSGSTTETKFWYTEPSLLYNFTVEAVSSHDPAKRRSATWGVNGTSGGKSYQTIQMPPPLPAYTKNNQRCQISNNTVTSTNYGSRLQVAVRAPGPVQQGFQNNFPWDEIRVYKWDTRQLSGNIMPLNWTDPTTGRAWNRNTAAANSQNSNYTGDYTLAGFGAAMMNASPIFSNAPYITLKSQEIEGWGNYTVDWDNSTVPNRVTSESVANRAASGAQFQLPFQSPTFVEHGLPIRAGAYLRWTVQTVRAPQSGVAVAFPTSDLYGNTDHRINDNISSGWAAMCWTGSPESGTRYGNLTSGGTIQNVSTIKDYPAPENVFDVDVFAPKGQLLTSAFKVAAHDDNHWAQP